MILVKCILYNIEHHLLGMIYPPTGVEQLSPCLISSSLDEFGPVGWAAVSPGSDREEEHSDLHGYRLPWNMQS